MTERRNIAVLGSTGSIGRQTLDIIAEYPDLFNAWLLVARSSADLLIQQARQYRPHMVIIADEQYYLDWIMANAEDAGDEGSDAPAAISVESDGDAGDGNRSSGSGAEPAESGRENEAGDKPSRPAFTVVE